MKGARWTAVVMLVSAGVLGACKKEAVPVACERLADMDDKCSSNRDESEEVRKRSRSATLRMCRLAFAKRDEDAPGERGEAARFSNPLTRHMARCAEKTTTCEELERCKLEITSSSDRPK